MTNYLKLHRNKLLILAGALVFLLVVSAFILIRPDNKKSKLPAEIAAKQASQYKAAEKKVTLSREEENLNEQKMTISDFYRIYLANKKKHISQTSTMARYGTDNLIAISKTSTAAVDLLTCSSGSFDLSSSSISVGDPMNIADGKLAFLVEFRDSNYQIQASPHVTIAVSELNYKLDSVACPGQV